MKNLQIKDLSKISMFAALIIVAEWLESFLPTLENGGSLALSQLMIMAIAIIFSVKNGDKKHNWFILLNATIISLFAGFALGLFPHMKGPTVLVLDYIIPFTLPTLLVFVKREIIPVIIAILCIDLVILSSHTLSGILIFKATLKFSLMYNITYVAPTFLTELVVISILTKNKFRLD